MKTETRSSMMVKLVCLCLVMVLVILPTGCSKKGESEETGKSLSEDDGTLGGAVTVWSWDVAAKALEEAAVEFNKTYPDVEIDILDLGNSQAYEKLTTALLSGEGLPEIVTLEGERIPSFINKFPKDFVELSEIVDEDKFLPIKMSECKINGKIYAFPWDGAPCGLYYREDFFDEAGIKAEDIVTWDDFIEAGKKMNDIGVKMIPVAISKNDTLFRMILNEMGSFYFDEEGNTTLNDEAAVKAMSLVKRMYEEDIILDNVNWDGLVTASKEGKVATVANAVWWAGTLKDECTDSSGKWRIMKLPVVDENSVQAAVNGGSNIVIPAKSENKRAAMEFVKFAMTDHDSQINAFSKYGLYPSYEPIYSDSVFENEEEYFGNQQIWKLFVEIGKDIPSLNFTQNFAETNDYVKDVQAKVTLKDADVQDSMDKLQNTIKAMYGK